MTILGIVVRSMVVLVWLGVITMQVAIVRIATRGDLTGPQRAWQGKRLVYALSIEDASGLNRPLGSCRWQSDAQGAGQRVDCSFTITEVRAIPGVKPLLPLLDQLNPQAEAPAGPAPAAGHAARPASHRPPPLTVHLTQLSGADGVVASLAAEASYGELGASLDARFLDQGLQVSWQTPLSDGSRSFPPLHGVRSVAVIGVLPSRIRIGRSFSIPMLGADTAGLGPRLNQARFHCTAEEEVITNLGALLLSRVEEDGDDHRLAATLWCDDSGLVYRQRWEDLAITLELTRIEPGSRPDHATTPPAVAPRAQAEP